MGPIPCRGLSTPLYVVRCKECCCQRSTHIENIGKRKYVKVGPGRTMVPTELGVVLIQVRQQHTKERQAFLP